MNLYPLDPLPSFTHYKNLTLIPKNQVYSAGFSFSGTLFWINLLHLSASFHRSHRNLSIFQICLKVAIISNVLMSTMTRWKETETALQSKPYLLKELVTKIKKIKNPQPPTNYCPKHVSIFKVSVLLLFQYPIWIYWRRSLAHSFCSFLPPPSLNALEKTTHSEDALQNIPTGVLSKPCLGSSFYSACTSTNIFIQILKRHQAVEFCQEFL